jgi:hypothetical protein
MAVPTSSQFLSRFPEFGEQAAPVIAGALEEAGRFTPETQVHEGGVGLNGQRFPGRPWTRAPLAGTHHAAAPHA